MQSALTQSEENETETLDPRVASTVLIVVSAAFNTSAREIVAKTAPREAVIVAAHVMKLCGLDERGIGKNFAADANWARLQLERTALLFTQQPTLENTVENLHGEVLARLMGGTGLEAEEISANTDTEKSNVTPFQSAGTAPLTRAPRSPLAPKQSSKREAGEELAARVLNAGVLHFNGEREAIVSGVTKEDRRRRAIIVRAMRELKVPYKSILDVFGEKNNSWVIYQMERSEGDTETARKIVAAVSDNAGAPSESAPPKPAKPVSAGLVPAHKREMAPALHKRTAAVTSVPPAESDWRGYVERMLETAFGELCNPQMLLQSDCGAKMLEIRELAMFLGGENTEAPVSELAAFFGVSEDEFFRSYGKVALTLRDKVAKMRKVLKNR